MIFEEFFSESWKSLNVWWRIAQLTGDPPKWANTFWKSLVLTIWKSTKPFLWVFCELSNSRSKSSNFLKNRRNLIFRKITHFWSRIARLSDYPQKWFCTFWNCQDKAISESIRPFQWVSCELRNLRSNIEWFSTFWKNPSKIIPKIYEKSDFWQFSCNILHDQPKTEPGITVDLPYH